MCPPTTGRVGRPAHNPTRTQRRAPSRRLLSALVALVCATLAGAGCSSSLGGRSTAVTVAGGKGGCSEGADSYRERVHGMDAVHHCGPASARLTFDGATHRIDDGHCDIGKESIVVNVGRTVVDASASQSERLKVEVFGLSAGRIPDSAGAAAVSGDGTYTGIQTVLATAVAGGRMLLLRTVKLTLRDDRSRGEFDGTTVDGTRVHGEFSCD